jgi:hypothetical protein
LFKDEHHQNYSQFSKNIVYNSLLSPSCIRYNSANVGKGLEIKNFPLPPSPSPTNWQKKVFSSACCQTSLEFKVSTFMFIHRKETTYLERKKLYFKGV